MARSCVNGARRAAEATRVALDPTVTDGSSCGSRDREA
jgi:hypothetical protein